MSRGGGHRVLHIGRKVTSRTIRKALTASNRERYAVEWVDNLSDGLKRLTTRRLSAVLLDLGLPGAEGLDGLKELIRVAPAPVPVLVVGSEEDDEIARQIIGAGARDYLLHKRLDSYWLPRAIRHAIERRLADEALVAETQRVEVTLNAFGGGLINTDLLGQITAFTSIAEAMTGWSRAEAIGRPLKDVLHIVDAATREPAEGAMERATQGNDPPSVISYGILINRDGSESAIEHSAAPISDRQGQRTGAAVVFRDVSVARAKSLRIFHLASHDSLTDLPNRLLLTDRLARALTLARRYGRRLAVLFLDLDRFKHINDSLGHLLGDELLRSVAREVTKCVRSSDTVSRQGGDEFVVVLSELHHVEDAAVGAQKIMAALARPHKVAGHVLHITASVGISVYPDDGEDAETLLKCADLALYHSKDQGRGCFQFFKPQLNVRAAARQSIEADLRHALDRQQFELLYQPTLNLQTGAVVGAEALIRWRHPEHGLIEPAQFLSIAEDCGLITVIDEWVVHEACRQARAWQNAGLRPIPVSVNISAIEFRGVDLLANIVGILKKTGLDPRYLEIELTERALMAHVETTSSGLHALKALGVQLAIDDFGMGWSSLSRLRHFPIDALKIDKSFLQEIHAGSAVAPVVTAVISLGKSLKRRVIAEGVETPEQLAFLQAEGCGEGQGYYFSRPVAAPQFAALLADDIPPFGPWRSSATRSSSID